MPCFVVRVPALGAGSHGFCFLVIFVPVGLNALVKLILLILMLLKTLFQFYKWFFVIFCEKPLAGS